MAHSDDIGGKALQTFLDVWNRHPLSLFVLVIFLNLGFVFMLFFSEIDPQIGLQLAVSSYIFSGFILLLLLGVLYKKRGVLYNVLEIVKQEAFNRLRMLQETLLEAQIGIGDREDKLERLCPGTARNPIAVLRKDVYIFECLATMFEDDEDKDRGALANFALAKFYYKEGQFHKALQKIRRPDVHDSKLFLPGEVDFCEGVILKALKRTVESNEHFRSANEQNYPGARCFICSNAETFVDEGVAADDIPIRVEAFLELARKCTSNANKEICLNKLSHAFLEKGKSYCADREHLAVNLRNANSIFDLTVNLFDAWVPYYNKACAISIMAQNSISTEEGESFAESRNSMKEEILKCLEKAYSKRPALARFSLEENDLRWVKENYAAEFNELIGRTYVNHFKYIT